MPSAVGICRAVVSLSLGYCVRCPTLLTLAVSATKMSPSLPPRMYAFWEELGTEITARPEVNTTYLMPECVRKPMNTSVEVYTY